jgi:hypothetical protein
MQTQQPSGLSQCSQKTQKVTVSKTAETVCQNKGKLDEPPLIGEEAG